MNYAAAQTQAQAIASQAAFGTRKQVEMGTFWALTGVTAKGVSMKLNGIKWTASQKSAAFEAFNFAVANND